MRYCFRSVLCIIFMNSYENGFAPVFSHNLVLHGSAHILWMTYATISPLDFRNSAVIPSGLGALLFLTYVIINSTSWNKIAGSSTWLLLPLRYHFYPSPLQLDKASRSILLCFCHLLKIGLEFSFMIFHRQRFHIEFL